MTQIYDLKQFEKVRAITFEELQKGQQSLSVYCERDESTLWICVKLAQHDTCCEFNFTEWLQACSQVPAANKESKQAAQEQEVLTAGREKIPLASPTAGAG